MANKTESSASSTSTGWCTRLAEAKDNSFKLRFKLAIGQLDNTSQLRAARRQIARINTVLREKEIAAAEAGETT